MNITERYSMPIDIQCWCLFPVGIRMVLVTHPDVYGEIRLPFGNKRCTTNNAIIITIRCYGWNNNTMLIVIGFDSLGANLKQHG